MNSGGGGGGGGGGRAFILLCDGSQYHCNGENDLLWSQILEIHL